ncbi:MAG: hypothetical protein ACXWP5_07000 [Bdellovibrionota bacterium]
MKLKDVAFRIFGVMAIYLMIGLSALFVLEWQPASFIYFAF